MSSFFCRFFQPFCNFRDEDFFFQKNNKNKLNRRYERGIKREIERNKLNVMREKRIHERKENKVSSLSNRMRLEEKLI